MPYADKEKQKEYLRLWTAARRAEFFKDKSCVKCGSTDRMELDHIDRGNKVTHKIWSWSTARREAEIAKCQVLCYTCHKQKTKEEQQVDHPHGFLRYKSKYLKCRCSVCRKANADWERSRRERLK